MLLPGTPIDGDTRHTFGCSSPRIDGDTDERYLMVFAGTHTPDPLLRHLKERSICLLSFDTLGTSNRGRGAHPRYLDDTWYDRGKTSQWGHRVAARVDTHKSRDEVITDRDVISFIIDSMPRELVTGDTCFTLSTGHVWTMDEQRISCAVEIVVQYVSKFSTLYRHILQGAGRRTSGDGWQEQDGSTYTKSIAHIRYPSICCIQGVAIWHTWFPVVICTTQWQTPDSLTLLKLIHDVWNLYMGGM